MTVKTRLRAVIRCQLLLVMFQRRRSAAGREGCWATVTRVMLAYSSSGTGDTASTWLHEISFPGSRMHCSGLETQREVMRSDVKWCGMRGSVEGICELIGPDCPSNVAYYLRLPINRRRVDHAFFVRAGGVMSLVPSVAELEVH